MRWEIEMYTEAGYELHEHGTFGSARSRDLLGSWILYAPTLHQ